MKRGTLVLPVLAVFYLVASPTAVAAKKCLNYQTIMEELMWLPPNAPIAQTTNVEWKDHNSPSPQYKAKVEKKYTRKLVTFPARYQEINYKNLPKQIGCKTIIFPSDGSRKKIVFQIIVAKEKFLLIRDVDGKYGTSAIYYPKPGVLQKADFTKDKDKSTGESHPFLVITTRAWKPVPLKDLKDITGIEV